MSGPATLDVLAGALLDGGAKATVVLAAAWLVTRSSRLSPAARHVVWSAALLSGPALVAGAAWRGVEVALPAGGWAVVWALGAAAMALHQVVGWLSLEWMRRQCRPHPRAAEAWLAPAEIGPLTWGVWPRVVLPRSSDSWSEGHLRAVLAHERAHAGRSDWLVHMWVRASAAVLWFHPLVWVGVRAHGVACEQAADARAVAGGVPPSELGQALLHAARASVWSASLGVGGRELVSRVHALVEPPVRPWPRWWVLCGCLVAAAVSTPLVPVALWAPDPVVDCQPDLVREP